MLSRAGYVCLDAGDGQEALGVIQRAPDSIDLVPTDLVMRRMGGPELARRPSSVLPDLRVLFMSGYSEEFTAAALMGKLRETLHHPSSGLPQANFGVGGQ